MRNAEPIPMTMYSLRPRNGDFLELWVPTESAIETGEVRIEVCDFDGGDYGVVSSRVRKLGGEREREGAG